jgi:hypothetical protein
MMCLKNIRIKTDHRRPAAGLSPGSSPLNISPTWGWPPFCDHIRIQLEKSPCAAAADKYIGAGELFVAESADRDPQPVRSFPTDEEALSRKRNLGFADNPLNSAFKSSPFSIPPERGTFPWEAACGKNFPRPSQCS